MTGRRVRVFQGLHLFKAGVCRPCDTIELTATSCNFSLCRLVEKVNWQLVVEVEHARLSATVGI